MSIPVTGPTRAAKVGPSFARASLGRIGFNGMLWLGCALLVTIMAVVQIYDIWRRLEIVMETTEVSLLSLTRALAEQTRSATGTIDTVLHATATTRELVSVVASEDETKAKLRQRIEPVPGIIDLVILDAGGRPIANARRLPRVRSAFATEEYFLAHRGAEVKGLYVSAAQDEPGGGKRFIALSRRLEAPDGRWAGVVVAFLDVDYYRRMYAEAESGLGMEVSLLRSNGELLARYPVGPGGSPFPDEGMFRRLTDAGRGVATRLVVPDHGGERIYALNSVPGYPVAVGTSIARSAVLAPWSEQVLHSTVRTSLLCLSVLLLTWLVTRQLGRRERAERELRVQTAQLDELFESAPEAIVLLDLDRRILRVNREFTNLFGFTPEEARHRPLDDLIVPAGLRREQQGLAEAVSEGRHTNTDTERLRKDGSRLHVSELGAPVRLATGQIASFAIYRDITEQKLAQSERAKLESRLRQAEKLEAIGTMAGGIAHDFNGILTAILGYGELAVNAAPAQSIFRRYAMNVMTAAHRAQALVDQILTYSRSTRGKRVAIDVCTIVEEVIVLVRVSLAEDVVLTVQLPPHKVAVIADQTHIHQIVMNLCRNAIQALHAGGVLGVELEVVDVSEDRQLSHGLLAAGRYVRFKVRDNGVGMDPAIAQRIFEPFFTTKDYGAGTGLGLALVHGIVTDLGGAIDVDSKPSQGSVFTVYLPRSDAEALSDEDAAMPRGNGERILLVEDEKPLMLLTEEMLAALSYEPAGFTRPAEALAEFRSGADRFDAVVLDYLMPGMSGAELTRHLRAARADIPVVLVSSYVGPVLIQEANSAGVDQILTKPLNLREFAKALAHALAGT